MTTFINFDSDQPLEMDGDVAAKQFLSILFHHLDQNVMPEDDEYDLIMKIKSILTKGLGQAIQVTRNELGNDAHEIWTQALESASGVGLEPILPVLQNLEPYISWIDEAGYRAHHLMDTSGTYSYFEVIGPRGIFRHDLVTVGFMMLSADFYYPAHSHPDFECIFALSGRSTWHMEKGPIISIPSGTRIYIPPNRRHTFWTMERPFAAIYLCLETASTQK
jgi:mannose-6-phosphate isomerase-like protein (cupin superfamily)